MNLDNSELNTYVLIDTSLYPSYAFIEKVDLTEREAMAKNYAFGLNSIRKKYILEGDWNSE